MIKYVLEYFPLSLDQRQKLFMYGQQFYDTVQANGGFMKVYCQRELPKYLEEEEWINLFQTKLISYEYQKIVDGLRIQRPYFFTYTELLECWNQETMDFFKQPINVISLPKSSVDMILLIFGLPVLRKKYGTQYVEQVHKSQNQITLNQFLDNQVNDDNLKRIYAKIAIPKKYTEFKYLKHFMPVCLVPSGENDALSYLRSEISGINQPQIEFLKNENWQTQSLKFPCFFYINVNVGNAVCEWITINQNQINQLRNKVIENFQIDIFTDQTPWLQSEVFFLENKIAFTYLQQNPGDIIVFKPGTYALAKSSSLSVNFSWHQAPINQDQLQFILNQLVKCDRQNANIPIKNLLLDIVIHEKKVERFVIEEIKQFIEKFIDEDNTQLSQFNIIQAPQCFGKREEQFCNICNKEIFIYFYYDQYVCCLDCGKIKQNFNQKNIKLQYRFHCIKYLVDSQEQICNLEFCSNYIGKTKCQLQGQFKQVEKNQKQKNNQKVSLKTQVQEKLSEDLSSGSDQSQFKQKNKQRNMFGSFTILKKTRIE